MPPKSGCKKRKERAQKDAELKKIRGSFDRFLPNKNGTCTIIYKYARNNYHIP